MIYFNCDRESFSSLPTAAPAKLACNFVIQKSFKKQETSLSSTKFQKISDVETSFAKLGLERTFPPKI